MSRLAVGSTKFSIGEEVIAEFEVVPLLFNKFVELSVKVLPNVTSAEPFVVLIQRERLQSQVTCLSESGKKLSLDGLSLHKLPRALAKQLIVMLSEDEGQQGEIIGEGDGISSSLIYKLGTPIAAATGPGIEELEFYAPLFGDIEYVLAEDNPLLQTRALISRTAKPAGMVAAPSWLLSNMSLADGFTIMQTVLPRFLN